MKPAGLHYCCNKCRETNGRQHSTQCEEAYVHGTRVTAQENVYEVRTKNTAIEGGAKGTVGRGREDQPPLSRQRPSPRQADDDDPRAFAQALLRSSRGERAGDDSARRDDRSRTGEGRRDAHAERTPESRTPTPRSSDTESRRDERRDDARRQEDRRQEAAREAARQDEDRRRGDARRRSQQQSGSRTERSRGPVYEL